MIVLSTLALVALVAVFSACVAVLLVRLINRLDTNTPDTVFSLGVAKYSARMRTLEQQIGEAFTPAFRRASDALVVFGKAVAVTAPAARRVTNSWKGWKRL